MTLAQILLFIPAAFIVGASPGANNLLALLTAAKVGWRQTAKGLVGRIAAWALLVVLVSFGLDAVLRSSEVAFTAIKWLGVGYLVFLAWTFWTADDAAEPELPDARTLMRREFLTLMGNPKAYLLLTAFLPQFVSGSAPIVPQLMALGMLYLCVEVVAALLWIWIGSVLGAHALTPCRRRMINRGSAGLLGIAALVLARSERAA